MLDIFGIQEEHEHWESVNFPNPLGPLASIAGLTEELGEVAHAVLKNQQKIRGYDDMEKTTAEVADGLADLFIYSLGLATFYGIDLEEAYRSTWDKIVNKRDWIKFPGNGVDQ